MYSSSQRANPTFLSFCHLFVYKELPFQFIVPTVSYCQLDSKKTSIPQLLDEFIWEKRRGAVMHIFNIQYPWKYCIILAIMLSPITRIRKAVEGRTRKKNQSKDTEHQTDNNKQHTDNNVHTHKRTVSLDGVEFWWLSPTFSGEHTYYLLIPKAQTLPYLSWFCSTKDFVKCCRSSHQIFYPVQPQWLRP